MLLGHRDVARHVHGERALAHARAGREHDQVAGLQARGEVVDVDEAGGQAGVGGLAGLDRLEVEHRLVDQVAEHRHLVAVLAPRDLVDALLGVVGDRLGVVGRGVGPLHDVGGGGDQAAAERRLRDDLGVVRGRGRRRAPGWRGRRGRCGRRCRRASRRARAPRPPRRCRPARRARTARASRRRCGRAPSGRSRRARGSRRRRRRPRSTGASRRAPMPRPRGCAAAAGAPRPRASVGRRRPCAPPTPPPRSPRRRRARSSTWGRYARRTTGRQWTTAVDCSGAGRGRDSLSLRL